MSNNKQSSVDFIYESLRKHVRYDDRSAVEIFDKIFADGKAMHKEEMVELAKNSYIAGYLDNGYYEGAEEDCAKLWDETYGFEYNETFGE